MEAEIFNLVSTVMVLISLVILILQTRLINKQLQIDHTWRSNDRTISMSITNIEKTHETTALVTKYFGDVLLREVPISLEEIHQQFDLAAQRHDDDELRRSLTYILSRYEGLGLAIEQGLADFDTVYKRYGRSISFRVTALANYIDWMRVLRHRPLLYEYAVRLAIKIEERYQQERLEGSYQAKVTRSDNELKSLILESSMLRVTKEKSSEVVVERQATSIKRPTSMHNKS